MVITSPGGISGIGRCSRPRSVFVCCGALLGIRLRPIHRPRTVWLTSHRSYHGNDKTLAVRHGEWLLAGTCISGTVLSSVTLSPHWCSPSGARVPGRRRRAVVVCEPGGDTFQRTAIGLDTTDYKTLTMCSRRISAFRNVKDAHEVEQAVAFGSMTIEDAEAARVEAERAIRWIQSGDHPAIDDRWRTWTPPLEWGIPMLAPGWETLPTEVL